MGTLLNYIYFCFCFALIQYTFVIALQTLELLGMISEDHDHAVAVSQLMGSPTPYSENSSSELVCVQLHNRVHTNHFQYFYIIPRILDLGTKITGHAKQLSLHPHRFISQVIGSISTPWFSFHRGTGEAV